MVRFSKRRAALAVLVTIRFFTFLLCIKRSRKFPARKRISTAIAEKRSGGCWRFCRAYCSLANMAKTRKSKRKKEKKTQKPHPQSKSKPKSHAKNRPSARGGTPDPTNPKRVAAILEKLDEAYPNATCALKHA